MSVGMGVLEMRFRNSAVISGWIICAAAMLTEPALAQSFEPDLLVEPLGPGNSGPVVQSLRQQNALAVQAAQQIPSGLDFPSARVVIEFDGDSFLLTANGMLALRSVALALKDQRLKGQRFQVAGHFVSLSDPASAQRISSQRAQTVVEHLVAYYQIPHGQLVPVGYGAAKLADAQNYSAPINTSIEFINLLN